MMGNGKAKLLSSLKFKNLECADSSFLVGKGVLPRDRIERQ